MKRTALIITALMAIFFVSCVEDFDTAVKYPTPDPKSEIGKALVENTDYICTIYKDSTYSLHAGVEVTELAYLSMEGRSMRTFWYKIDLTNPEISLKCITPFGNENIPSGSEVLSQMLSHADKEGSRVIGGVNSDFGGGAGPQGVYWSGGKCLKNKFHALENRPRSFVCITKDKKVEMGYQREYEDYIAANESKISEIFCGSPRLLADGKINIEVPNDLDDASHPRTAIGIMPDQTTVYLLVADGRRYTYSNGMYLEVLANVFAALGCSEAMNLDGGGSSTFVVGRDGDYGDPKRFEVRNWCNDNGGSERELYNGLAIISNK